MDKLITGIIIGGAAASIFGIARTKKGKKIGERMLDTSGKCAKKGVTIFGKTAAKIISLFEKK